jgi:hypothetical protein
MLQFSRRPVLERGQEGLLLRGVLVSAINVGRENKCSTT